MMYVRDWDENGEEIIVRKLQHRYVLLSVGDQSLHKNGEPLTHDEIFSFLWEQFLAHQNAAFVGFFLGYDFTFWLKSIPEDSAWSLLTRTESSAGSRRTTRFPTRSLFGTGNGTTWTAAVR
jgi:hypothetical protein